MRFLTSVFLLFFLSNLQAQATIGNLKTRLSMSDAILKEWRDFYPADLSQAQFVPNSTTLSHVANGKIVLVDAATLKEDSLDLLPAWNKSIVALGEDSLKGLPPLRWENENEVYFHSSTAFFVGDKSGNVRLVNRLPESAQNIDEHKKTYRIAYTDGDALKVSEDGKETLVAKSEDKGIVYGQAVHRFEFGIYKGTFWSPEGNKLAFYRKDERMVTQYPIYNLDSMPAAAEMIYYPFAGAKSHHATVGVFDVKTGKTIYLQTGEPKEQYLTNVEWTPDGKSILIAVLNRGQDHMKLNQYDAQTGAFIKTLFEEKDDKWVEPEHPALFVPNSNDQFVWHSERDGFMHLYLYDLSGKMILQLSKGKFPVTDFVGFDQSGSVCFWEAADETGMNRHYYVSELNTGRQKKLTQEDGTHKMMFSGDGTFALNNYQSLSTPRMVYLLPTDNPSAAKLYHGAANHYEKVQIGTEPLKRMELSII